LDMHPEKKPPQPHTGKKKKKKKKKFEQKFEQKTEKKIYEFGMPRSPNSE
jgi:hypothetical protein